ncbi:YggS family pyridoxal phosphate-dependent enzyme [Aliikangiella sp. IMCC44632]
MTIADQIQQVRANIELFCQECARPPENVRLLAVSKTHPISSIQAAFESGITDFGESYIQEAVSKVNALSHLPITWHFIGPIQSNKTKFIAAHFHWVQSVDREKILKRLNDQRPAHLAPINVCLQANLFNEPQKQGASLEQLHQLLAIATRLPNIKVRGIMVIPPAETDFERQMQRFSQVKATFDTLKQGNAHLDTLSMGMSGDIKAAIFNHSTMVRVGTTIFGPRGTNHL